MRKAGWAALTLLVLTATAVAFGPGLLDWTRYRADLAAEVEGWTGRPVVIAGDVRVSLVPVPSLVAENVSLANPPHSAVPDMLSVNELRVRLAFWPLLRGELHVRGVELVGPVLRLERLEGGRSNWLFTPSQTAPSLQFDRIEVRDGVLELRDAVADRHLRITDIVGTLGVSPDGQRRGSITGTVGEIAAELEFSLPDPDPGARSFWLALRLPASETRVELVGTVQGSAWAEREVAARLEAETAHLGAALQAFGTLLDRSVALHVPEPAKVVAQVTAAGPRLLLDQLSLEIGETRADGELRFDAAADALAGRLAVAWLDLDELLPEAGGGTVAALPVPQGLTGGLDLRVGAVAFRGGVARDLRARLSFIESGVTIEEASALLPGSTVARLSGVLMNERAGARFEGAVQISASDARAVLDWFGLDLGRIPADRLRSGSLTMNMVAHDGQIALSDLDLRLDASRIKGALAFAVSGRPSFSASLTLDRLNLDAYGGAPLGGWRPDLSGLDANLKLAVGQILWRQVPMHEIALEAVLYQGSLEIRELAIGEVAGGSARAVAAFTGIGTAPRGRAAIDCFAQDASRLARLFGYAAPPALVRLAPLALSVEAEGGEEGVVLSNLRGLLGGMRLSGDGALRWAGARPRIELTLATDRMSPDPLLAAAANSTLPPIALDAMLDLRSDVVETAGVRLENAQISLQLVDGQFVSAGLQAHARGGSVEATAAKNAAAGIAAQIQITDFEVGQGLAAWPSLEIAQGRLDLAGRLEAKADHGFEILKRVTGDGTFVLRDGVLRGRAIAGSPFEFSRIEGPLRLAENVLLATELVLTTATGEARGQASLDLRTGALQLSLPLPGREAALRIPSPGR